MAMRLGMPIFVHRAKQDLLHTPTVDLVDHLRTSSLVLKCNEFVQAISEVLARRIQYEEHTVEPFSTIPYDLMEDILRNSELDVLEIEDLEGFMQRYMKLRQDVHGKQPSATSVLRLRRLVEIHAEAKKNLEPIREALQRRVCTFSPELSPYWMIHE